MIQSAIAAWRFLAACRGLGSVISMNAACVCRAMEAGGGELPDIFVKYDDNFKIAENHERFLEGEPEGNQGGSRRRQRLSFAHSIPKPN